MNKKRYLILGLVFICTVYLFVNYFLTPASENYRESLEKEYKAFKRYESVVKGSGAKEAEIQSLITDMKNTEKRLITEKSDFLASAKLQGEIAGLTGKTGLNVTTIRPMNAVKMNAYNLIPIYFEGNADIKQMSAFLKLVETDPLLLKIDKLSLTITNMQKPEDLKFRMQISGMSKI